MCLVESWVLHGIGEELAVRCRGQGQPVQPAAVILPVLRDSEYPSTCSVRNRI